MGNRGIRTTLVIGILQLLLLACLKITNSNTLNSNDFETTAERVSIVKKEIKSFNEFQDAEFLLFNVNGFSDSRILVPGASSWNYKFVLKLEPSDVDKWVKGAIKIDSLNYNKEWHTFISPDRRDAWETSSIPEFYTRKGENVSIVLHRPEGIIVKHVINE